MCFQPNRSPFICCEMDGSCFLWSSRWMSLCFPLAAGKTEGWASFCIRAKCRKSFLRIDFFLLRQVEFAGKFELRSNKLWKTTDFFYYASCSPCCHSATRLYLERYLFSHGLLCLFFQQHWFSHRPLIQCKYSLPSVFLLWWNSENSQIGQNFPVFIRVESKKWKVFTCRPAGSQQHSNPNLEIIIPTRTGNVINPVS